jgi:hypothetical protein
MRVFRLIAPGALLLLLLVVITKVLLDGPTATSWIPTRSVVAMRGLAIAFMASDVLIAFGLIALLVGRDRFPPKSLKGLFPLSGRWLWYTLFSLVVIAYASLGPVFLFVLAKLRR